MYSDNLCGSLFNHRSSCLLILEGLRLEPLEEKGGSKEERKTGRRKDVESPKRHVGKDSKSEGRQEGYLI